MSDKIMFYLLDKEEKRWKESINLVASENEVSDEVLKAIGHGVVQKYSEGFPSKRYYNGCKVVDEIEQLAIDRAKEVFKCVYANVQPHSGSHANAIVYDALLEPNDVVLSMGLDTYGHLTHSNVSNHGKHYKFVHYGVDENGFIDYDDMMAKAKEHKPKLIIIGTSSYPRKLEFKKARQCADEVGAYLMGDIAHFAGLIAGEVHENPFPSCDVATMTTHKTLRGVRGGLIISDNIALGKKFNRSTFPRSTGGSLQNNITAKGVTLYEALQPNYKEYQKQVLLNAKAMSEVFANRGVEVITGGTDNHIILLNTLTSYGINGKDAANILEEEGIVCNMNVVPNDPMKPSSPSGIRLGSSCQTTRGWEKRDFEHTAMIIDSILRREKVARNRENKTR